MTSYQLGVLLALGVAATWTGSALAFSNASRRVGSVPVNLIRLVIAFAMLTIVSTLSRGQAMPTDATRFQASWLAASGVVGFFVGDLTLFRAFVLIGPRRATLLMSLAPAFAAAAGWLAFGERLNAWQSLGVLMTLAGVMWVIAERESRVGSQESEVSVDAPRGSDATAPLGNPASDLLPAPDSRLPTPDFPSGILLGLLGAAGQGIGAVLTKHAFRDGAFDPFASTQLRAIAAIPLFALFVLFTGRTRDTLCAVADGRAMLFMTLGAFAGPFLGVSMFNASVARIPSGVTSTLAGMVPVFMLPVAAIVQRERITRRAAIGATVAVTGVALLALGDRSWTIRH